MEIRKLEGVEEMVNYFPLLKEMYTDLTLEEYEERLLQMLPHSYHQIAVFENQKCLAICGYWLLTKVWCGKYLELDNVVVSKEVRSKGIGKKINQHLEEVALREGCKIMALDAFTTNFKAHKFYYNQGFGPKGFHFVKFLNEEAH